MRYKSLVDRQANLTNREFNGLFVGDQSLESTFVVLTECMLTPLNSPLRKLYDHHVRRVSG